MNIPGNALESPVGARRLPRNLQAYELSRTVRREIRALLEQHPATAPALTAKAIQPALSRRLSLRAIQWHIRAIRYLPRSPSSGDQEQLAARVRYLAQLGNQVGDIAQALGVVTDQVIEWIEV